MLLVRLDNFFFFLKEGKSFKRPRTLENKVKGEGSIVSELPWDFLYGTEKKPFETQYLTGHRHLFLFRETSVP